MEVNPLRLKKKREREKWLENKTEIYNFPAEEFQKS